MNNKNNENKLSDNLEKEIKIKIWDNRTKNIKIYQTLYKILCGFFNGYLEKEILKSLGIFKFFNFGISVSLKNLSIF